MWDSYPAIRTVWQAIVLSAAGRAAALARRGTLDRWLIDDQAVSGVAFTASSSTVLSSQILTAQILTAPDRPEQLVSLILVRVHTAGG